MCLGCYKVDFLWDLVIFGNFLAGWSFDFGFGF